LTRGPGEAAVSGGAEEDLETVASVLLTEEERVLVGRVFGLPGFERATPEDLASEAGLTQQAVSKRVRKLIKRLEDANWAAILKQAEDAYLLPGEE
jgi:hypothetical protein